jgi:hypothetical protein
MAAGGMLLMTPILSISCTFHCLAQVVEKFISVFNTNAEAAFVAPRIHFLSCSGRKRSHQNVRAVRGRATIDLAITPSRIARTHLSPWSFCLYEIWTGPSR